jgi:hypothetical protein
MSVTEPELFESKSQQLIHLLIDLVGPLTTLLSLKVPQRAVRLLLHPVLTLLCLSEQ